MAIGEKTYPPSPSRLRAARARGDVAKSRTLAAAIVVAAGAGALAYTGPGLAAAASDIFAAAAEAATGEHSPSVLLTTLADACRRAVIAAAPLVLVPAAAAAGASLVQTGPIFAGKAISPSLARLSPGGRFRAALFNGSAGVELLRGLALLALVGGAFCAVARPRLGDLTDLTACGPSMAVALAWRLTLSLCAWIAGAALLLGAIDLLRQKQSHRRALSMTREEWLRELREEEGDPSRRAVRRRAHREMA